ncbi:MAG: phage terminase small subunit P27 family [Hyphomonadaceae bacterium]|nr:phage terminase small subunit P27 family [Hyphomonadaceae bacterium]
MKRGPLPKPADVDALDGNPSNRTRKPPPRFGVCIPHLEPPSHLSTVAKKFWRENYEPLRIAGTLTPGDLVAFELLCQAYARWRAAEDELKTSGAYRKAANGLTAPSPFFRIARQCGDEVRAAMADFGMTPPSRMRLSEFLPPKPPHKSDEDEDEVQAGEFTGLIGKRDIPAQ